MSKNIQADFKKAVKRANLFAEQAVVVTLGLSAAKTRSTTTSPAGEVQVKERIYEPKKLQKEFLDFLTKRGIGHAVIFQDENTLTFAVRREKDMQAEGMRAVVDEFFSGGKQIVLSSIASFQSYDSTFAVKNALLKPFSKMRRDVSRIAKNL